MGSFNIMGSYSGIDMATIDQMIEAEKGKGVKFTNRKDKIEREQGAWKDIGARLESLGKKNDLLRQESTFESRTVKSNAKNSSALKVTAGNSAQVGKYVINVKELATSSKLVGSKIESGFIASKDGQKLIDQKINIEEKDKFTFTTSDLGKDEKGIEISTEFSIDIEIDDTLRDIVGKINSETGKSGVEANVIGGRLVLTDTQMGDRNITVTPSTIAEKLGFDKGNLSIPDTFIEGESLSKRGQQSEITVNDIEIKSDTNQITDEVDGLTIDLLEKGQSETITISNNTDKAVSAVKDFIEQYNSVMSFIKEQTDVGNPTEEKNKTGALVGEGSIMRLQANLRQALTAKVGGGNKISVASSIGIEIDRYGVASLDEAKLNKALQEDPSNVARFFYQPEAAGATEESGKAAEKPKGVSELLDNFIESYTGKSQGIIKTKQDSYDRMLKDISKQIDVFDERIEKKRARYITQFTALDQAMMLAESQMAYLYSQMNMGQN